MKRPFWRLAACLVLGAAGVFASTNSTIETGAILALGIFVEDRGYSSDYASTLEATGPQNIQTRIETALKLDYIKGFALMYSWRSFAPASVADASDATKYHYQPIDYALQVARKRGKQISITLVPGAYSPKYVPDRCPTFTFTHTQASVGTKTVPWPWTAGYYEYLDRAILALAKRYDGDPDIRYVSIIGPSTMAGVETNWPMKRGSLFSNSGRAPTADDFMRRYVAGWKRNTDFFISAFPHTQLALGLHNEILYDGVRPAAATAAVQEIRDYAIAQYEKRTARTNKKLVLRLLGLTDHNRKYFWGPNDGTDNNLTGYVRLVWDRKNLVTIMYEGSTFSNLGTTPVEYLKIFRNGYSWGGMALDVGYPDLEIYREQIATIASWYAPHG